MAEPSADAGEYSLVLASEVTDRRDGLGLELHDRTRVPIAEVFRDDERDGALHFLALVATPIPFATMKWFIERAEQTFGEPEAPLDEPG